MKLFTLALSCALIFSSAASVASDKGKESLALPEGRIALVVTDPQNDFLNEKGVAYGLFEENLKSLGTIDNIERLFKTAKSQSIPVFVSPHAYFQHDHSWKNPGALQKQLLELKVFGRKDAVYADGLKNTGADFLPKYKSYILDGKTVVTSPHKVYGPDSNDLLLQLRSNGIDTVVLAGLAANLCTDSHLRELVENGFKVVVVKDAVAAPGKDAYNAAVVNYGLIANAVMTTDDAIKAMKK
ncbi:MAG: cysteine hydrolase [Candidatus Thiodiazotropha sp. (ex Monitilora ramsayi)]|nr:cysteine hydrolase [Candidatus Thiodiazotropha sp. (ex Monitilora ramsayi)]